MKRPLPVRVETALNEHGDSYVFLYVRYPMGGEFMTLTHLSESPDTARIMGEKLAAALDIPCKHT